MCSATAVLVTVHPQMLDVMSMCQFLIMTSELLGVVARAGGNMGYDWMRYLVTRYEPGDGPQNQMVSFMRSMFGDHVLNFPMLKSTAIADAGITKQTLYEVSRDQFTRATYDRAIEALDNVNGEIEQLIRAAGGGANGSKEPPPWIDRARVAGRQLGRGGGFAKTRRRLPHAPHLGAMGTRGAIGAVTRSIEQLKAHSVVELAPDLIDASFIADRLKDVRRASSRALVDIDPRTRPASAGARATASRERRAISDCLRPPASDGGHRTRPLDPRDRQAAERRTARRRSRPGKQRAQRPLVH